MTIGYPSFGISLPFVVTERRVSNEVQICLWVYGEGFLPDKGERSFLWTMLCEEDYEREAGRGYQRNGPKILVVLNHRTAK